jgi:hypothetical protein
MVAAMTRHPLMSKIREDGDRRDARPACLTARAATKRRCKKMRKWCNDEPHLGLPSNLQPYPCSGKFF